MNTDVENIIEEPVENTTYDKKSSGSNDEALDEQETSKASSEFALKLVNSVKKNHPFSGVLFKTWGAELHFPENRRVGDFPGWRGRDAFQLPGASVPKRKWFRC